MREPARTFFSLHRTSKRDDAQTRDEIQRLAQLQGGKGIAVPKCRDDAWREGKKDAQVVVLPVDLCCSAVCFLSCAGTLHKTQCWMLSHLAQDGSGESFADHMCRMKTAFTMSTTEERPVISDEEFHEDATVRLSDALKELFHELKDKFEALKMEKTMESMAQNSGDASDQMTSLQCVNSKDMIKPDQYDMEPGTLHNLNELFVGFLMSIDRKWRLILTTLQRKDAVLKKKDIFCVQDELKIKDVANHALHLNLLGRDERQRKRPSYFKFDRAFVRDVQANLPEGKNATKMNIVLKKADMLRHKKGRHGE